MRSAASGSRNGGTIFASANPVFGSWVDQLVPHLSFNDLVGRAFLACFVFAATLLGVVTAPTTFLAQGNPGGPNLPPQAAAVVTLLVGVTLWIGARA